MEVRELSERYSPHGNGYIKVYRKILTSAVFSNANTLKVWIWCLVRANWYDATAMFDGKEIVLKLGQLITGRYTGSEQCEMNPSTFYRCLKKLEEIGNIVIKSDNKKSLITIVNYEAYQGQMFSEWQQGNNKVTAKEQQSNTDKEVKKERSKEERVPPTKEDVDNYFSEMGIRNESSKFFDYFESNGWRVGRNKMKDWRSAARNWKRRGIEGGMIKPQAIKKTYLCDTCKQRFNTYELYMNHMCPQALPPPKEFTDALNNLTEKMSTEHR